MKISNRILIGFFAGVFLVPVLTLMSFKSKIRKGEFTASKDFDGWRRGQRSGSFNSFRVVKLLAPEGRSLNCSIYYSDTMSYNYGDNGHRDSLHVYNQQDTLFMQYVVVPADKNNNQYFNQAAIDAEVYLPSISHLIVENSNAAVKTTNPAGAGDMIVELSGDGIFRIGISEEYESNDNKPLYKYGKLSVKSDDGAVRFGNTVQIDQLYVDAKGKSSITIDEGASIKELSGDLSDSSSVKASWKYVKKLVPVNK